jgi:hypothetical protein
MKDWLEFSVVEIFSKSGEESQKIEIRQRGNWKKTVLFR